MADTNRQSAQTGVARTEQQQDQSRGMSRRYDWPFLGLGGDLLSASPFGMMRRLSAEMDRLLSEPVSGRAGSEMRQWSPAIEVRQKGDNLVVCADLPGISPENVSVEVDNDTLIIEGERKHEESSEQGGFHRSERSYGRFYRAVPLPQEAKTDAVNAEFNNGVLEITIPVEKPKENRRRIEVQSGQNKQK
ncbi:MAG TPA: Hsp20/alpha crystallin family protein [Bryobacteraceae bacterium]|nr:Hsp20/alpha crystallin family protein [Bryobacteraceae bacterium]